MKKAELVVNMGGALGEGICWDETERLLYWIDISENKIFVYNMENSTIKIVDVRQNIGFVALREQGGLVAGLEDGLYSVDVDSGETKCLVKVESDKKSNRFNDGECDCMGRIWAGTMAIEDVTNGSGSFYCIDTDFSVEKKIETTRVSNGVAFSPDNKTMYHIDSPTGEVCAYDFDKKAGQISGKRCAVNVPQEMGFPDGMTVDSDGNLWVGMWAGSAVVKYDGATGQMLEKIDIPALHVTTMVFGGADMDEMFVITAKKKTDLNEFPNAGGMFRVKMDVKGLRTYKFGG